MLREATRIVGVVPNAAYRHFADRDALLAAVRSEAVRGLAQRMADGMSRVRAGPRTPTGAGLRLQAVGRAYLDFARTEPGLFDTAFAVTEHPTSGEDDLVQAGLLDPARRPEIGYPTWAAVHGLAVLLRGPLRSLSDREKTWLEAQTLAFIGAALS